MQSEKIVHTTHLGERGVNLIARTVLFGNLELIDEHPTREWCLAVEVMARSAGPGSSERECMEVGR